MIPTNFLDWMKLSAFILIAAANLNYFAAAVQALPMTIVDQSQTFDNGTNNSGGAGLSSRKGQTFIPTLAGLDAVELKMGSDTMDGIGTQFLVNIRQTNPTGTIVGTSQITTRVDGSPLGSIVHFDFDSVVPLTIGGTYAIELVPVLLDTSDAFSLRLSLTDSYANGIYFSTPTDSNSSVDAWFQVGLHQALAIPLPEPSSASLVCCSTLGLMVAKSRRRNRLQSGREKQAFA